MRNMYQLSSVQYLPRIIVCVFIAKQMVSLASFSKQQLIWDYLVYLLQIQLSEVNMNCLGENNIYKNRKRLIQSLSHSLSMVSSVSGGNSSSTSSHLCGTSQSDKALSHSVIWIQHKGQHVAMVYVNCSLVVLAAYLYFQIQKAKSVREVSNSFGTTGKCVLENSGKFVEQLMYSSELT
uniref:Uncharacterized protein n=1 Tax=Mandrillus leucophaeus TaxID=9568 RepID=A0A2K5ZUC9_MANLE